jgi:hypothetical protein
MAQIGLGVPSVIAIYQDWAASRTPAAQVIVTGLRDIGTVPISEPTKQPWLDGINASFVALLHRTSDTYSVIASAGFLSDLLYPVIRVDTEIHTQGDAQHIFYLAGTMLGGDGPVSPPNANDLLYARVETETLRAVLQRSVNTTGIASLLIALPSGVTIKRRNASLGECT